MDLCREYEVRETCIDCVFDVASILRCFQEAEVEEELRIIVLFFWDWIFEVGIEGFVQWIGSARDLYRLCL